MTNYLYLLLSLMNMLSYILAPTHLYGMHGAIFIFFTFYTP